MSRAKPLPDAPELVIRDAECFALMPDGRRLAVARAHGAPQARVVDLASGRSGRAFSKLGDNIRRIAVSQDGRRIAFGRMARDVFLCRADKGTPERTVRLAGNGELMGLCFGPRTGMLVCGTWDTVVVIDPATGETSGVVRVATGILAGEPHFQHFAFSREASRMAVAWSMEDRRDRMRHYVTLFSWPTGEELERLELRGEPARLAFAPDGGELFVVREDGTVEARGLSGGERSWKAGRGAKFSLTTVLAVSPDGALLVFGHSVGTTGRLEIWSRPQRKRLAEWTLSESDYPYDIGFTRDGSRLLLAFDGRIEIHQVASLLPAA